MPPYPIHLRRSTSLQPSRLFNPTTSRFNLAFSFLSRCCSCSPSWTFFFSSSTPAPPLTRLKILPSSSLKRSYSASFSAFASLYSSSSLRDFRSWTRSDDSMSFDRLEWRDRRSKASSFRDVESETSRESGDAVVDASVVAKGSGDGLAFFESGRDNLNTDISSPILAISAWRLDSAPFKTFCSLLRRSRSFCGLWIRNLCGED